jgi:phosphoribosylformylglycinamidine (FGAM) synthase-like enzyme
LSDGGLAVALAEMAMAGGLGAAVSLDRAPCDEDADEAFVLLFSESPTRFVLEVAPEDRGRLERILGAFPLGRLGEVRDGRGDAPGSPPRLTIDVDGSLVVDAPLDRLKEAWQGPLRWP